MKEVSPTYDFLGWYSTGSRPTLGDIEVQKQLQSTNENPLFMQLNTALARAPTTKELPIEMYESELIVVGELPTLIFVRTAYKVETGEAERIGVDHITHAAPTGGPAGAQLAKHYMTMHNAVKMLAQRIRMLQIVLKRMTVGETQQDYALLRHLSNLTSLLPAVNTQEFNEQFLVEYNDALLTAYLATITKEITTFDSLINKFLTVNEKHTQRRRGGIL